MPVTKSYLEKSFFYFYFFCFLYIFIADGPWTIVTVFCLLDLTPITVKEPTVLSYLSNSWERSGRFIYIYSEYIKIDWNSNLALIFLSSNLYPLLRPYIPMSMIPIGGGE